jgi:hypothetical protein
MTVGLSGSAFVLYGYRGLLVAGDSRSIAAIRCAFDSFVSLSVPTPPSVLVGDGAIKAGSLSGGARY